MKRLPNLTAVTSEQRRVMTQAESKLLIVLTIQAPEELCAPVAAADLEKALLSLFKPEAVHQDLSMQVIIGRLKLTDKLYDPRVVAMASFISDRPGFAVLWAYTLYERTRELGRPYTFDDFVDDFPFGFPNSDGAAKIWDAQKGWSQEPPVSVDNMLDRESPWKEPVPA
jgi:hypothetical protein